MRIEAARRVINGADVEEACRAFGLSANVVRRTVALVAPGDVGRLFGDPAAIAADDVENQRFRLSQLVLGALAEERFEREKQELTAGWLTVEDHRLGRGDTDYRVLNGGGRPIFRINIKFHGSAFEKAQENVGLDPQDCFALATYKIHQALVRQQEEALPYVFVVLSCLGLTAKAVATAIPEELAQFVVLTKTRGKRDIEDAIVRWALGNAAGIDLSPLRERISRAEFRVISAARAERIMKEKLFERVFALRRRAFTSAFRRAEIDMHFSLMAEMIPLRTFLATVVAESPQRLTVLLDRGELA